MNRNKIISLILLIGSILASLTGIAFFIILFALDLNIYWFILSPVILAIYQIPAVCIFWIYKKYKKSKLSKLNTN